MLRDRGIRLLDRRILQGSTRGLLAWTMQPEWLVVYTNPIADQGTHRLSYQLTLGVFPFPEVHCIDRAQL